MRQHLTLLALVGFIGTSRAETPAATDVTILSDINYKSGDTLTDYERSRCKLDVYLPTGGKGFATLVWFHGGGLTKGDKGGTRDDSVKTGKIARSLAMAGIAVVTPNYRLSPKVTFPAYLQDAAAAAAWTREHIAEHGGDPKKLFIGGHSAGGYLTLMLALDAHYLADAGVKAEDIAGFIPVSGQTMTHYTVRAERGEAKNAITADEAAPVHFARAETSPILVLYADRDMAARAEENAYFVALMQGVGNKRVSGLMIRDRTHGSIAGKMIDAGDPARGAILEFIRANSGSR